MASKQLASAVRNASKCQDVVVKLNEKVAKSHERMMLRIQKAEARALKAAERLSAAREALDKAKAKVEETRKAAGELLAKQEAARQAAVVRANKAEQRKSDLASKPGKVIAVGGTVTDEDGNTTNISKAAAKTVSKLVGRKASGSFKPLDCEEAVAILDVCSQKGTVGNIFTVQLKGRKAEITFSVEGDGLAFQVGKLAAV